MRDLLRTIIWTNNKAKRLAIRLRGGIHPKHFMPEEDYWYMPYIVPGDLVLDVGCGTGAHSFRVAAIGESVDVVGIDRSPPISTPRVKFLTGDMEHPLPFPDDMVDVILCLDVLEHVRNRRQLISEMRRVLHPEGDMLLSVPQVNTSKKRRLVRSGISPYSDPDHKIEYTMELLEAELRTGGFGISKRYPGVYDTNLTGIIDVLGGFSLTFYRWATNLRRRLAARHPEEDAGFYVVCTRL